MVFQYEHELEEQSVEYINRSFKCHAWQVPLFNRVIDFAGIDNSSNLISIEFKLKNWKKALAQAIKNSNAFDYVFVCVPGGQYLEDLLKEAKKIGVGVLCYDNERHTLVEKLKPMKIEKNWLPNRQFIESYIMRGN